MLFLCEKTYLAVLPVSSHLSKLLSVILIVCLSLSCTTGHDPDNSNSTIPSGTDTHTQRVVELTAMLASPRLQHADKWKAVQEIRSHGRKATLSLLRILDEEDKGNGHYYAIRALGYIKDPNATEALCKILLDPKYGPRRYAAIALGQIADPCAVDSLEKALHDVAHVRADALDALVKVNSKKAREVLEQWHFGNMTPGLQAEISCDKSVYAVGDQIRINAKLTNITNKSVQLAAAKGERYGYLVFRRKDGSFVEEVGTRMWEARVIRQAPLRELVPGAKLEYSFFGSVAIWKRGEKDDHTFLPSSQPFLTLDFQWVAFHIRQPGEYEVRLVFKQDENLLRQLKVIGISKEELQFVWQGKVVSNPVSFSVAAKSTGQDNGTFDEQLGNKASQHELERISRK